MRKTFFPFLAALLSAPVFAGTIIGNVVLARKGASLRDASNAVVWIEDARTGGSAAPHHAEMKSEKKKFAPRVVVVNRGASIEFPNADPIYHNVFSVSGGNRFDLGLYKGGTSKSASFETPGLVRVYCNIHPQMVGFVMVVDSRFAALTGPDGSFRFEGVPAGPHVVKAWHEESGESEGAALPAGAEGPVTIRLDVTNFHPQAHKNKYGKDYAPGAEDDERY